MTNMHSTITLPITRPKNPNFSSGPCAKRPGWTLNALRDAPLGRSHRTKLKQSIDLTREILKIPADYRIGIVPASDTGAFEMAMWCLLGQRPVTLLSWESFGAGWVTDAMSQLKLSNTIWLDAPYGELPNLSAIDSDTDIVFTWNGTTSGVRVDHAEWIQSDRQGLTLCDATSAAFAMDLPWDKLDVVTYSWQKVLGGEGAHGMLILSPRAVQRLETYKPSWPLPKIFRLTSKGKLIEGIFEGETINTPSMLCVEDYLDALLWAQSIGGLPALIKRSEKNAAMLDSWVAKTPWIANLAEKPETQSNTSVCLKIIDPWFLGLSQADQQNVPKQIAALLEKEKVAYDINGYRDAPPGLRIWCGATVETADIEALTAWLEWAYATVKTA
jgi:phosphoserine aminotransferase